MHSLLSSIKWLLIILMILAWLGLCLINMDVASPLIVLPSVLEFQRVPISVTLIFPLLAAFVTFFAVGLLDQVDHFLTERDLRKRIRDLEAEVSQLRNLPIRESLFNQRAVEEENRA